MVMELAADLLLLSISWAHVLLSPFTKVEESFNLHATHDIFFYGLAPSALENYNHFIFPGAVPRSFVGSVILAWILQPVMVLGNLTGLIQSKFHVQIALRLVLTTANVICLRNVGKAVGKQFGRRTRIFFVLLCCSQFHLPFWMGRTLPNMFALVPFNQALAYTVTTRSKPKSAIFLLTFAAVVFRAELAVYLAIFSLSLLLRRKITLWTCISTGAIAGVTSLLITLLVDSYFWQRWPMWPELQGILFNVVEGKSSEWGVSPFHVYWTIHLPKLLLGALPLGILGILVEPRTYALLLPPVGFVAALSALAHKEWRFVIYVVPVFNIAAACGASYLWKLGSRNKGSWSHYIARLFVLGSVMGSLAVTALLTMISRQNYPGGEALFVANNLFGRKAHLHMHIANLAAQSGASLFLQEHSPPYLTFNSIFMDQNLRQWTYDKAENLKSLHGYSHAIVEDLAMADGWDIKQTIFSFERITKTGLLYAPKLWIVSNPSHS